MSTPSVYYVEAIHPVDATAGVVTTNGGVTGQYISLKNVRYVWLKLQFTQAVGHATAVTIKQATAIAGTGVKTGPTCNIWLNEATATNDTLVAQTAGTSVTLTNDIKKKMVVIAVDPASLDINNGFDVLGFSISDSSQATNFVCGSYECEMNYAQATPPTVLTD